MRGLQRPWQSDSEVSIDRFDGRAHLDFIPEYKPTGKEAKGDPELEDGRDHRKVNYERYRILIQNEYLKGGKKNIKLSLWNLSQIEFFNYSLRGTFPPHH